MKKSILVIFILVSLLSACNFKPYDPLDNIILPEGSFNTSIVFSVQNKNTGETIIKDSSNGSMTGTITINGVVHYVDNVDSLNTCVGDTLVLLMGLKETGYWVEPDTLSVNFLSENWHIGRVPSTIQYVIPNIEKGIYPITCNGSSNGEIIAEDSNSKSMIIIGTGYNDFTIARIHIVD